jgi:hypothetical protein
MESCMLMRKSLASFVALGASCLATFTACSGDVPSGDSGTGGAGGTGATPSGGGTSSGSGGTSSGGSSAGTSGSATGGAATGGTSGSAGAAGSGGTAGSGPATCSEAAAAYTLSATPLDASLVPSSASSGFGNRGFARLPVAVDTTNQAYVGLTTAAGAVIAPVGGGAPITVPGAVNAGIAVTNDGLAVLLFDPNTSVDARTWAAVRRVRADGSEVFQTDLFRSPNLDDEGTKGAPSSSRLGYVAGTDTVVAYFAHTQRYDDGVRHQGGYLATLDASGEQTVLSGWFGSHNLDQRLLVDAQGGAVLGLGDAYPEGIFFSFLGNRPNAEVLYALASAGNGATNGQLGGMVDLGDAIVVPFITNRSIPQDLDAGTWPDIDDAIAQQIRDAAANGTDMGLLSVPKTGMNPDAELEAVWLTPAPATGARLESLKAARYGEGGLVLLAWAESTGSNRQTTSQYFTMVVDRMGAVCQPKTPLAAEFAFTSGDDIVRRADGAIVWATLAGNAVSLVTLTPG